ncbi:MAG: AAA family ATPase [Candidatus Aenigmarchaeota archaeon]|nr:AAA family ATPase [Candidatus Aenigmarchaeota archaeon]
MDIELNDQFKHALNLMNNSNKNIFITGKAGTGKSTLLNYFRNNTKKKITVLAPTGVAAINVEGQTIHSFFKFKPDITLNKVKKYKGWDKEVYEKIEAVVIDEISMVRADLLDCIDKFMRLNGKNPAKQFGGVQMIFIGDLYQLPPVVTSKEKGMFISQYKGQYFFDSITFQNFEIEFVELEKIYRQKDNKFINLLNSIRNNSITQKQLESVNERLDTNFNINSSDFFIQLTTTNKLATEINENEISKIKTKLFQYNGIIEGKFEEHYLPTDIDLKLKIGSQVMLVNNDQSGRYVNGTVGKIIDIRPSENDDVIIVELFNKNKVEIRPHTWKIFELYYDRNIDNLDSKTMGSFRQYPIKLAWAITIHKSQGKTFDRVIIDIGKGTFTHGQVYVALSRCTSLDGIILKKPIQKKHIFMDWKIVNFLTKFQYKLSEKRMPLDDKMKIIQNAIRNRSKLNIVYLKSNDQKSKRVIKPFSVGEKEYMGKKYVGVDAYCFERRDMRVFRIDKILEIEEISS